MAGPVDFGPGHQVASRGPQRPARPRTTPLSAGLGDREVGVITRFQGFRPLRSRGTITAPWYFRDVAQSGSALQWGCRGRGFKSRRPDWASRRSVAHFVGPDSTRHLGDILRVFLLLVSAGLFACSGSADREASRPPMGFSASLGVDTTAMTKTPSGLRYQDITEGQGAQATADRTVSVHYTGWLPNGEKFDSSRDRNQPFSFTLGSRSGDRRVGRGRGRNEGRRAAQARHSRRPGIWNCRRSTGHTAWGHPGF